MMPDALDNTCAAAWLTRRTVAALREAASAAPGWT